MSNPLRELAKYGQSVWYDYIRRALIESGDLKELIDEDGLSSVTSNPSIFEKAIAGSTDYDRELEQLAKARDVNARVRRLGPGGRPRRFPLWPGRHARSQ